MTNDKLQKEKEELQKFVDRMPMSEKMRGVAQGVLDFRPHDEISRSTGLSQIEVSYMARVFKTNLLAELAKQH